MRLILPAIKTAFTICREQKRKAVKYRFSCHCVRLPCEEGELLYQNMTGALILLEKGDLIKAVQDELIRQWMLVPKDFDEYKFAIQFRQIAKLLKPQAEGMNSFMIFPTMDCNARCFYCYELGRKRQNMSEQTAHDTALFIAEQCKDREVELTWFGGEPLFNRRAIDIITDDLAGRGILFRSKMASNGYLFDRETVSTAVEKWNLHFIQITLDGTEQIYNQRKAYINQEGSPYRRVLRNIGLLSEAGVDVDIRLNMDAENTDDLIRLGQELADLFQNQKNVKAYAAILRDFRHPADLETDKEALLLDYTRLRDALKEAGIGKIKTRKRAIHIQQCMADNDQSVAVLPDGQLGKCEHGTENSLIGSIYSFGNGLDQKKIDAWKETVQISECRTCPLLPTCVKLKQCPWTNAECTPADRKLMTENMREKIRNTYLQEINRDH